MSTVDEAQHLVGKVCRRVYANSAREPGEAFLVISIMAHRQYVGSALSHDPDRAVIKVQSANRRIRYTWGDADKIEIFNQVGG